jgi:hypothetical protein
MKPLRNDGLFLIKVIKQIKINTSRKIAFFKTFSNNESLIKVVKVKVRYEKLC